MPENQPSWKRDLDGWRARCQAALDTDIDAQSLAALIEEVFWPEMESPVELVEVAPVCALREETDAFGGVGEFEFLQKLDQGRLVQSHRVGCPSVRKVESSH